jgi:DNA-binding beta-propeller fold protein YncE
MTGRSRLWSLVAVVALLLAVHAAPPAAAADVMGVDGNVEAVARCGSAVYVGGTFYAIGRAAGGLAVVSPSDGSAVWTAPRTGTVAFGDNVIADGAGGWYAVDGEEAMVVHIDPAGAIDPRWRVSIPNFGAFRGLARAGSAIIVAEGDTYSSAAVEAYTSAPGAHRLWHAGVTGDIDAITASATTVYIGGFFLGAGGTARGGIAALDAADGSVVAAFDPRLDGRPYHLALDPSGAMLYVSGAFTTVNGAPRDGIAAISTADGSVDSVFAPSGVGDTASALAVDATTVYVAGRFSSADETPRRGLAGFDRATGALTSLNVPIGPGPDSDLMPAVTSLSIAAGTLYLGGSFLTVAGVSRPFAAAIDTSRGALTPWDPRPAGPAKSVTATGTQVAVSGDFDMIQSVARRSLAAFDAGSGALLPFDLTARGEVTSLACHGSKLFIGGAFSTVGGKHRRGLAAVDLRTGRVSRWHTPGVNRAFAITVARDTLYASDGSSVLAFSATTAARLRFALSANRDITVLAASGSRLYVSGRFTQVNSSRRQELAAVDGRTGRVLPWSANLSNPAFTILPTRRAIFLAGSFSRVDGARRGGLAALRPTNGRLLKWNPQVRGLGLISSAAISGQTMYLTGQFSSVHGAPRRDIAAVSLATGRPTTWTGTVESIDGELAAYGSHLFGGGDRWAGLLR